MKKINQNNKKVYRQGDVLLVQVEAMPEGRAKKVNSFVLAFGEQTGHKHLLVAEPKNLIDVVETEDGKRYIKILHPAKLIHEEHKTITVFPGIYEQRQEREFDWFQMVVRRVID
jgi:hypothetical protein